MTFLVDGARDDSGFRIVLSLIPVRSRRRNCVGAVASRIDLRRHPVENSLVQDLIVPFAKLIANVLVSRRRVGILNSVRHDLVEKIIPLVTRQQVTGQNKIDIRILSLVILRRQKAIAVAEKTKHSSI